MSKSPPNNDNDNTANTNTANTNKNNNKPKNNSKSKFVFHYRKHKHTPNKVEAALLYDIQNYIPIYSRFFDINSTNYNQIQLNHKYYMNTSDYYNGGSDCASTVNNDNSNNDNSNNDNDDKSISVSASAAISHNPNHLETCIIDDAGNEINVPIFVKYSPLIDPIKYLSGKYDVNDSRIHTLPTISSTEDTCDAKMLDKNNASYVDAFFSYLTSQTLHHHGNVHGVDFYGTYLSKQREFSTNIFDDIEYLTDCDFFNKHKDELFSLD